MYTLKIMKIKNVYYNIFINCFIIKTMQLPCSGKILWKKNKQ